MNIPSFPAPSPAIVKMATSGKVAKATREWVFEARSKLHDGTVVAPSNMLALSVIKGIAKGLPAINIAVAQGKWQTAHRVAKRIEAEKLKSERFAQFMAEDKPALAGIGVCDTCGVLGSVDNHYAPDGMGYPALVLQTCPEPCKKSK